MKKVVMLDSFSGSCAELKKGKRTDKHILACLSKDHRVSTWDMSEMIWLRTAIQRLIKQKLIKEEPAGYPWHSYSLTDDGRKEINE